MIKSSLLGDETLDKLFGCALRVIDEHLEASYIDHSS